MASHRCGQALTIHNFINELRPQSLPAIARGTHTSILFNQYNDPHRGAPVKLTRKMVHQFVASRHMKMSTTSLFNIRKGPSKSPRDYLTHFNKSTIRVAPPNQQMFVGAFQNGLKAGNFNESPTQKPTLSLVEVDPKVECYIKGEGSNTQEKACGFKERISSSKISHHQRKINYTSPIKYKTAFKRVGKERKSLSPLTTCHKQILCEVFHLYNIHTALLLIRM